MKTRDKIKYLFATVLAIITCAAIGILVYANHKRNQRNEAETRAIQQTLSIYGDHGRLPEKIEVEPTTPPAATRQETSPL